MYVIFFGTLKCRPSHCCEKNERHCMGLWRVKAVNTMFHLVCWSCMCWIDRMSHYDFVRFKLCRWRGSNMYLSFLYMTENHWHKFRIHVHVFRFLCPLHYNVPSVLDSPLVHYVQWGSRSKPNLSPGGQWFLTLLKVPNPASLITAFSVILQNIGRCVHKLYTVVHDRCMISTKHGYMYTF